MMIEDLSFKTLNLVTSSWERAKQSESFEQLGMDTIVRFLELAPESRSVFGLPANFKVDNVVTSNTMARMALLIHGRRIIDMMDGLISALGPDIDMLLEFVSEVSTRHFDHGVKPEYFQQLGQAVREVLQAIPGKSWSNIIEEAWTRVFEDIAEEMARIAVKELAVKGPASSALSVSLAQ